MEAGWLGLGAAALLLLAAGWQFADVSGRRAQVTRRLEVVAAQEIAPGFIEGTKEGLSRTALVRRIAARLKAAGLEVHAVTFLLWCAAGLLAGFLFALTLGSWALAVILLVLAALAIRAWLNRRVDQRREQFVAQLPDLARLLSNAAHAGLAMTTAVRMAAREIGEPARTELENVTDLMAVGYPLDEALTAMSQRLPSREVSVLVTTLVVQQRSGGRIITALRNIATTLDTRKETRREIRTLMAGAIASTYIVAGIGLGSMLLLNVVKRGILDEIVGSPIGQLVLVFSGALYVTGFTIVRRMTRIEP